MKKLILILTLVLSCSAFAQFNITVTAEIDSADSTISQITFHPLAGGTRILADSLGYLDTYGRKLAAIIMDTAITAATFTFYTSDSTTASSFRKVQYDGSDISLTATDNKFCGLKPTEVNQFLRYVKIKGNVKEGYKRTIRFVLTSF